MLTQPHIIQDKRGYTITVSTIHQTHTGALAHFTELLARLHHKHHATKATDALNLANIAETNGPTQPSIKPSSRPRPVYRNHNNGQEEPPL